MKKYEENMNKYEGITLPIYVPWDLEKFQARPARRRGGGSQNTSSGVGLGERKDMKHVKFRAPPSVLYPERSRVKYQAKRGASRHIYLSF